MAKDGPRGRLDGVWWPRSRDLVRELADLVDHFPGVTWGRVVRVQVSPLDWDARPRHVLVRDGYVKVGPVPGHDTNLVHLTTSDRTLLRVLVVPPSFTRDQGQEALRAAGTSGHLLSAAELVRGIADHPVMDPSRPWSPRDGVTWWTPDPPALS